MPLALSTCVLSTSLMQPVNGVQFLNTTFSMLLFVSAAYAAVFATDIVPLTSIYELL